mmetsp:Transcript_28010/g.41562  ORF Transcript_28010/g.41562 Transcript_28010/m.41562 type:complete len:82 (+) Transcript_28010:345-590(+)
MTALEHPKFRHSTVTFINTLVRASWLSSMIFNLLAEVARRETATARYAEMEEAIVINDKYVYFLQNQRQELHILLKRTGFS